ncbi:Homeodomain-like protein, partial [Dichotomocladium elegans]
KLRVFSPVILFHDHRFVKESTGGLEHVHIPCGDPYYIELIETHKRRIQQMLKNNGRFWSDVRESPPPVVSAPSTNDIPRRAKQQPAPLTKRRRGNLPKAVTAILRDWLSRHKKHPYPTEDEKLALARQTNLTLNQISNWFINARRRILQPMLQKEQQERILGQLHEEEEDEEDNDEDEEHSLDAHLYGKYDLLNGDKDWPIRVL